MSATTVFYQQCPVCGRNLRVPVKYFGREMSCSHCDGVFVAGQDQIPRADTAPPSPASDGVLYSPAPDPAVS